MRLSGSSTGPSTAVVLVGAALLSVIASVGVSGFRYLNPAPYDADDQRAKRLAKCAVSNSSDHDNNQILIRTAGTPGIPRESLPTDFSIDSHEVTNAQFARFVAATNYQTTAERALDPADYPGVDLSLLAPGSAVFAPPQRLTSDDPGQWWRFIEGANWRNPEGPDSTIDGKDAHPVVHVTHADAKAYAAWAGRRLPTEIEWQLAARYQENPGRSNWHLDDDGEPLSNTWQGAFPLADRADDAFAGLAPTGCFPPSSAGLYDMIGNVWEWVDDAYRENINSQLLAIDPGSLPPKLRDAGVQQTSGDEPIAARTIKGGSYLCSGNFCMNYRPEARLPQEATLGTSHIGFRTVTQ